jgi:cysteine synthase A
LEGIGSSAVYVPLSKSKIDGVFGGNDQLAIEMAHYLLKNEGLFVGKCLDCFFMI